MRLAVAAALLALTACAPDEPETVNAVGTISELVMEVDNCKVYRIWLPNEETPRYLTRAARGSTAFCGLTEP